MKKLAAILTALLVLLSFSGCWNMITGRGNMEPDHELPKLRRDMIYAPDDEVMSLTDAFADAGLELPDGVGFIDYDSDEYILAMMRYENKANNPIEATVYFYDGEEEVSSVMVVFMPFDSSATVREEANEGSVREGNVVCYPIEGVPMTKTARLADAADSVGEVGFNNRIYIGWSEEKAAVSVPEGAVSAPEGAPKGPAGNALIALMMRVSDRYGVAAPLGILALILLVLYFILYRPYKKHLMNSYGFNLLGIPALFTCFCYFLVFVLSAFGMIRDPFSAFATGMGDVQRIFLVLAIGAPGMLWQTVNCCIRTRRFSVALFNVFVMYIVCFSIGYVFAILFIIYIILKILGLFNVKPRYKCPGCGTIVDGIGGSCPGCGARLV